MYVRYDLFYSADPIQSNVANFVTGSLDFRVGKGTLKIIGVLTFLCKSELLEMVGSEKGVVLMI